MDLEDFMRGGLDSGDNSLNSAAKEFEFVINGKNPERNNLLFEGIRCIGECDTPEIDDGILLEKDYRKWSEASSWDNGVPKEGDDVEIKATWNMLLDVANPPKFKSLRINGRVTFADKDITLQAHNIWVQAGQIYIGTADKPFEHEAKIVLLGETEDDTLVIDGAVEAGNKVLVNTGKVKMYGKSRDRQARLRETVLKGSTKT
jgi:hypothetical protein